MRENYNLQLQKKLLVTAITTSLGISTASIPNQAISDIYVWGNTNISDCSDSSVSTIIFTMLDADGAALANSSTTIASTGVKGANQFQTPTCGTLSYNTETETGSAAFASFNFFANDPSLPAEAVGITIEKIPPASAPGNSDNYLLSNMLFNWNGSTGIPVSLAWDAQALLGEMDGIPSTFTLNADGSIDTASPLTGVGAVPASDGTYLPGAAPISEKTATDGRVYPASVDVGGYQYLGLGPVPIATTAWNTTNAAGCSLGACDGVSPSGLLPLLLDTRTNANDFVVPNDGGTIGGNPMQSGAFQGSNANFDFTSMTLFSFTDTTPPVITLSGTQGTVINKTEGDSYVEDGATCTDAAPLNTNLNSSVVIGGTIPDPLTVAGSPFTVTYDCQDASTNDAVQLTRTINVTAVGVDIITLTADGNGDVSPVTHECAIAYTDAGATCTTPAALVYDGSALDVFTVATQSVTYTCNAATQDRVVNVEDTTNPVVTLVAAVNDFDSSTAENPVTYTDPGATVTDSCDVGIISPILATAGNVDMAIPDTGAVTVPYDLIYTAADTTGNPVNIGSATRTVNVTRSQPVITLVGGGEVLNIGDTYTEQGMNISDAQDLTGGDLTSITVSGTDVSGLSYTISGTVDTSTQGEYTLTYDVTDSDGNLATQASRTINVGIFASGSNFSMLDANGNVFGGTNDVAFEWDGTTFNTDEADTNFDIMKIATVTPQKFFSFVWFAHHIRVYQGPSVGSGLPPVTLTFDTTCTATQLEQGLGGPGAECNGPLDPGQTKQFMTMTIAEGQIGAHILFDWNTSSDIDVVNVWDVDGIWDRHGGTGQTNKLWDGPAGDPPDETTTWKLVSTDFDGDNINASPMIDGPFQGSNANFNAGPGASLPPAEPYTGTAIDTKLGSGLAMNVWGVLAGLFSLLALRRFSKKK